MLAWPDTNLNKTYFLAIAGIEEAFAYSTMVSCFGLLGVITSFFFVRYIDRRMIMLIGIGACGLAQLSFAIAWTAAPHTAIAGRTILAFTCLFTFFYVAYGKSSKTSRVDTKLTVTSTLCLASWRRISQQPPTCTRVWSRHR